MPLFVQTNMVKNMDAGSIQNIGVDLTPADVAKQVLHLAQQKDHALIPTHIPVGIKTKADGQLSSISPQFLNRLTNIFYRSDSLRSNLLNLIVIHSHIKI